MIRIGHILVLLPGFWGSKLDQSGLNYNIKKSPTNLRNTVQKK